MSRLALFDLDNTLIDREAAFRRWAADLVAAQRAPAADVEWLVAADGDGFVAREEFLGAVRDRYLLDASVEELLAGYTGRYPGYVRAEPAVTAALVALRAAGWRIAIVTNGRPEAQAAKIAVTGLAGYVDGVVVSGAVGVRKPDPRIFALAAAEAGAPLAGAWMVGDHPEADIAGGHGVGLRTIWLHRNRPWPPAATARPTHTAATIPAAVTLILAATPPGATTS